MSVLINGMEMPKSCYYCPLTNDGFYLCKANNQSLEDDCEECKPQWCPLIELPPHGRLIDADNLLTDKSINIIGKGMIFGGQYVFSESEIVNAPTIIPAEEGV